MKTRRAAAWINLAVLRDMALNLVRKESFGGSVPKKLGRAGLER